MAGIWAHLHSEGADCMEQSGIKCFRYGLEHIGKFVFAGNWQEISDNECINLAEPYFKVNILTSIPRE